MQHNKKLWKRAREKVLDVGIVAKAYYYEVKKEYEKLKEEEMIQRQENVIQNNSIIGDNIVLTIKDDMPNKKDGVIYIDFYFREDGDEETLVFRKTTSKKRLAAKLRAMAETLEVGE